MFREGERADGMHIVLCGVVKVVRFAPDGREMVLHLVRKGNTIGEAAMFQKGTFPASAVAVDDVETLFLPADALFTLVTENPEMALRMLAALSLRLRMFAHKLAAQGQGAVNATAPPFAFMENGKLVGFEVDLHAEVAKRMGKQLVMTNIPFAGLAPGRDCLHPAGQGKRPTALES